MNLGLGLAFGAGLASFLSPCVLPLVPTYLLYLAGGGGDRARILGRAAAFILGFSLVFAAMGLTSTALGQFLRVNHVAMQKVAGVVLVMMGIVLTGLLPLAFLQRESRPDWAVGNSFGAACLMGMVFAVGWTPCVGPVLAAVLAVAAQSARLWAGLYLLLAYAAGLAVPFLATALFLERLMPWLRRIGRLTPVLQKVTGGLLVLLGVLMYLGQLARLSAYLTF